MQISKHVPLRDDESSGHERLGIIFPVWNRAISKSNINNLQVLLHAAMPVPKRLDPSPPAYKRFHVVAQNAVKMLMRNNKIYHEPRLD